MNDLSAILGNKGSPYTLSHGGKTFTVSFVTQRVKDAFTKWLKKNALDALMEQRGTFPADVWQDAYDVVSRNLASKEYAFHGGVAQKALRSPAGALALAAILFGCDEAEMLTLMQARKEEVTVLMETVMKESAAPEGEAPNG